MKITSQNIPVDLQGLYDSLISTNKTGAHAGTRTRTRRGAGISPSKKQVKTVYNDITAAVEELIVRLGTPRGAAEFTKKVLDEKRAINAGIFNPAYWIKCDIIATDYLSNAPSSTANATPPPYAYRDSNNMPSLPVYGSGSAASAPARYAGATASGLFCDTLLVWSRTVYNLQTPIAQDMREPAIVTYDGTLTVAANYRGSRPMLSLVLRCYLTDATGAALTTTDNPVLAVPPASPPTVRGCNSFYWRYIIPATVAPFFNTVRLRKILRDLAKISTVGAAGDMTKAVIMTAPRPMFGRGFNNNTAINSSLAGTPDIYQIFPIFKFTAHTSSAPANQDTTTPWSSTLSGKKIQGTAGNTLNGGVSWFIYSFAGSLMILGGVIEFEKFSVESHSPYSLYTYIGFYFLGDLQYVPETPEKRSHFLYKKRSFNYTDSNGSSPVNYTDSTIERTLDGIETIKLIESVTASNGREKQLGQHGTLTLTAL